MSINSNAETETPSGNEAKITAANMQRIQPCIIVPCYNHGSTMASLLARLEDYQIHCIIVDDGSDEETKRQLEQLDSLYSWVTLIHHRQNQGKGAAVLTALRTAQTQGYTHGLQIDADGQHNLNDIPLLLKEADNHPQALISGRPVYDESVPKSRYYARYLTHVWVWIETLSFSIKDSMCGFRVYPVESTLALADSVSLGQRMDFDTDVMVRLYWQGVEVRFIPTKVIYPPDGLSHFDVLRDNLRISWMHTRLFLAMLPKFPRLLTRRFNPPKHWSQTEERKGLAGIRFMVNTYRLFGRRVFSFFLYPVAGYFWLTGKQQRQASEEYIKQLKDYARRQKRILMTDPTSFRHFLRFGEAMLDKLAGWQGDIQMGDINFANKQECLNQIASGRGTMIIGSHLGDLELCRALGHLAHNLKINALVFTKHAARFNQVMREMNPDATVNLIQIDRVGPDTAILLKQKLDAGEWIAIVGDRTSVNPHHRDQNQGVVWADFLGKPAPFPSGPFALAAALRCPVYLMFGLKPNGQFQIYFEKFADPLELPRPDRQQALQQTVQSYAEKLENYCLESPLDWFNFYDFWQLHSINGQPKENSNHETK